MYIYGINPIIESLNSSMIPKTIYIQEKKNNKRIEHIKQKATRLNIDLEVLDDLRAFLPKNAVHQGVAAYFDDRFSQPLKALPDDVEKLLILDGINDPHNFGAAIRLRPRPVPALC